MRSEAALYAYAGELLRTLRCPATAANVAAVVAMLERVESIGLAERQRLHVLLDDANRMLGRMAIAAAAKPGDR